MLLELQKGIIYGPVHSRRLGISLGINLLPASAKACSFNCVYCQYGWTKFHMARVSKTDFALPSVEEVADCLRNTIRGLPLKPAYLTFSGNGEPAMHPDFEQIVEAVVEVQKELAPEAKTAILSNSSTADRQNIRRALAKLDVRIMKLDCGSKETFRRYNQPCRAVTLESITMGLIKLSAETPVFIQALLSSGDNGNFGAENVREWIERLKSIKPAFVQIYTLNRGFPGKSLRPLSKEELSWAKAQVLGAGIRAEIF